ncbi:MAG: metal-sensing transcriptional repressor [Lachnospiraceae bacterium]|nr:metal-sensing transcriptional repressor [Lachnospiraceae bacterium]
MEEKLKEEQACCPCETTEKKKERSEKEYRDLMNRLKRIEGQVRGIQGMLENDAYCADILVQVAAVNAALNSFNKVLLANHVRTCVADNIRAGNDEVIDELVTLLQKLMR